ncbi:MAG TPA: serine/threonine-protein kinase [Planctomycetota bacterium]|nr:serine/threonine-protein kinase [Planctomycetota bacterium]
MADVPLNADGASADDARLEALLDRWYAAAEEGAPPDPRWFDGLPAEVVRRFAAVVGRADEVAAAALAPDAAEAGDEAPPPAAAIGGFRLIASRGGGGFARVFLAEDEALGRRVALKILRPEFAADPVARRRFRVEGEILASLEHDGVVPVLATGEDGPWCYLALKWIDGGTLADRAGRVGPQEAARIGAVVARALHAAHERGIVHRDVKPSNVLMDGDAPRLADFGLAHLVLGRRMTASRAAPGTPAYLAPETLEGRPPDPRVDVWGAGVTLYELVSGAPPFGVEGAPEAIAARIAGDDPRPLRLPRVHRDFEAIVARCLEKDPARRFPTAAALADDLERFAAGRPILSRRSGAFDRLARKVRRRPRTFAAAALTLLAAGLGVGRVAFVAARERALVDADLDRVERLVDEGRTDAARRLHDSVAARSGAPRTADVGARVAALAATDQLLDLLDLDALRDPRALRAAVDGLEATPAAARPEPLASAALVAARARLDEPGSAARTLAEQASRFGAAHPAEAALFRDLAARMEGRPVAERLRALEAARPVTAAHARFRRAQARASEDAGDYAVAEALLEGLVDDGRRAPSILCALARIALLRGDLDRAARLLELVPATPRSILRDSVAVDLLRERGDPGYGAALAEARAAWPGDAALDALAAHELRRVGRGREAITLLREARRRVGGAVDARWFDLAILEIRADDAEARGGVGAEPLLAEARALAAGDGSRTLRADAWVVTARLEGLLGRPDAAYAATAEALAADRRAPRAIEARVAAVHERLAPVLPAALADKGPDALPADLRADAADARAALENWLLRAPGRARADLVYAGGTLAAAEPSAAGLRAALARLEATPDADPAYVRALADLLRLREGA